MARTRSLLALLGIFSLIVSGFIFLTTSRTEAGFEWVPAKKETASPPVLRPAPAQTAPIIIEPATESSTFMTPVELDHAQDLETPVIKTVHIAPPSSNAETQEPTIKIIMPRRETVMQSDIPDDAQPVPDLTIEKTKIIMPDDAPDSALSATALSPDTQKNASKKIEIEEAPAPQLTYEEIVGFGSDMPLAFALSQIVPEGYAYSLGRNVNPATTVSWSGGKAWNQVVADMLRPHDLSVNLRGKTILIYDPIASAKEEKQSNVDIEEEAFEAPVQLTENETQRVNIVNPGQDISAQPEETMDKIEKIAHAQKTEPSTPEIEIIEPSSGAEDASSYKEKRFWRGEKGESAKALLGEWAQTANVALIWDAPHDFTLSNNILVNDDFENALVMLLSHALSEAEAPSMTLLETPDAPKSAKVIIK